MRLSSTLLRFRASRFYPLIVIADPSDPEAVIVPSAAPLQKIRLLHLLIQLLLIGSQSLLLL
jgi:hypothetical protein